ncbi:hypothetical protein ACZ90_43470 [Streptomyces albus subsp. albus]|nr:hypothetical protein ACZ90_43470 [Streptomyces albus subsp. albus]
MRDRLITALLDRVTRYDEQDDPSALFEDAALEEADRLRELLLSDDGSERKVLSLAALDALTLFHRARHRARPGDNAYSDYGITLRLSIFRARLFPDIVPEDFTETLAAAQRLAAEAGERSRRLWGEFERTRDVEHVDQAVHLLRCAVNLATGGDDVPGLKLAQLSTALMLRFQVTGDRDDLDEAIETREASIAATAEGHPELGRRCIQLSGALRERHEITGQRRDLERAVAAGRHAVAATSASSPARPRRMALVAATLGRYASMTRSSAELHEAVDLARGAVGSADFAAAESFNDVARLSDELRDWYDHEHEVAYLDLSVELLRGVVDAACTATRTRAQVELARAHFFRHSRTGDVADLDRALELERHALAATESTSDRELRTLCLTNLFISHRVRYERLGSPEDLDEAVRLGTEAVSGGARGIALSELSMAFVQRYRRTFEAVDIDRALQLAIQAVDAFPAGPDADRAAALSHLARVLVTRLQDEFVPIELDRMIDLARQAMAACPESHPDHVRHRADLAYGLLARYRHAGAPGDLDESIRTLESVLAIAPVTHPSRQAHLSMLAEALIQRSDTSPRDIDRAVSLARLSASLPGKDALAAQSWRGLGDVLRRRHANRGDPSDLHEAIECWQHATALPTGTFTDRIESATSWGAMAAFLGDMKSAAEGYDRAVLLLTQLAWHGLPRTAREKHLLEWPGLASTAAACHILAGTPQRAVEILEQGRTIIQSQLLHTRGDLSLLAERDPVLADRLLRVRERLDAQSLSLGTDAAEGAGDHLLSPQGRERLAQERAALCREWDEVLGAARRLEGFEYFLAPVPYAELSAATAGGPVVVVNVSHIACHALVIRPTEPVVVIELPGVTTDNLAQQAQTFLNVLLARRRGSRPFLRRERDRHAVLDVLEWLWGHVARPVLDRLGFAGQDGEPLPRLWWCPTGLLALLPLHAAGRHPRHRTEQQDKPESVPDRVVCSYTSTLTALRRARERAVGQDFRGLLTVGLPETPGRSALSGVERECGRLRAHIPAATATGDLLGPKATCEAVRRGLHQHSWAHFACHAEQDLMDPARSAFLLHDGRLTIAELLELNLPSAELAYLSACETAAGGVNLPDEAMHLASTLQSAGYRHVVATMWSIQDGSAADVAAGFYSALTRPGRPNADGAARALHEAVGAHRSQDPTDPLRWAAFLHAGP